VIFWLLVLLSAPLTPAAERSIFTGAGGQVSPGDKGVAVMLVRIETVQVSAPPSAPQQESHREVRYTGTVIFDSGAAKRGRVTVRGRQGVQGSSPRNIPDFPDSSIALFVVRGAETASVVEYAGTTELPIGIPAPAVLPERELSAVKAGLLKLGDIVENHKSIVERDEAAKLLADDNFYVWSLGCSALAIEGTEDDVKALLHLYDSGDLSVRKVLWLEYCLQYMCPEQTRPSLTARHELLLRFLRRQTGLHVGE
jgi:hypothetical protein